MDKFQATFLYKTTVLLILTFIFQLHSGTLFCQEKAKKLSLPERVDNLNLESTKIGEEVIFSDGYSSRAEAISKQLKKVKLFYREQLGIDVKVKVALLDTSDYNSVSIGYPYGMPFVAKGLIFQPANTSIGAVKELYADFGNSASESIHRNLRDVSYTYDEALIHMVDLIALHELGHVQAGEFIKDLKQKWFNEFMASYFSYTYMQENEPHLGVVWDNITHAGFEAYQAKHTSLDTFNELYFGVGVDNYCWFQNAFQERIKKVYQRKGISFITLVKEKLDDKDFQPKTAKDLLLALEAIEPGFIAWSESLSN